jgi:hypothetical protein
MRLRRSCPLKVTILRNRLLPVGQQVQLSRFAHNEREKVLFSKRVRLVERERFYQVYVTPENFARAPGASAVARPTAHTAHYFRREADWLRKRQRARK